MFLYNVHLASFLQFGWFSTYKTMESTHLRLWSNEWTMGKLLPRHNFFKFHSFTLHVFEFVDYAIGSGGDRLWVKLHSVVLEICKRCFALFGIRAEHFNTDLSESLGVLLRPVKVEHEYGGCKKTIVQHTSWFLEESLVKLLLWFHPHFQTVAYNKCLKLAVILLIKSLATGRKYLATGLCTISYT